MKQDDESKKANDASSGVNQESQQTDGDKQPPLGMWSSEQGRALADFLRESGDGEPSNEGNDGFLGVKLAKERIEQIRALTESKGSTMSKFVRDSISLGLELEGVAHEQSTKTVELLLDEVLAKAISDRMGVLLGNLLSALSSGAGAAIGQLVWNFFVSMASRQTGVPPHEVDARLRELWSQLTEEARIRGAAKYDSLGSGLSRFYKPPLPQETWTAITRILGDYAWSPDAVSAVAKLVSTRTGLDEETAALRLTIALWDFFKAYTIANPVSDTQSESSPKEGPSKPYRPRYCVRKTSRKPTVRLAEEERKDQEDEDGDLTDEQE